MVLKLEDITTYIDSIGYSSNKECIIWGTAMPTGFSYALFGAVSVLDLKYNVLQLNDSGIIIIPISSTSGKIIEGEYIAIPKEEVTDIKFSKGMLGYTLEVVTSKGNLKFKVRKKMLGANWHSANLENILKN
ncbi:hypothetical protein [Listeria booriae]|uniref:hypothetical protein n=1 Tax=Listeria booriae TaxID=1552123 RepID=UPI001627A280|nr:hypothetical protein [Listeria booriae]MBC2258787.1 hypothetical protein [Listeria booriae]